MIHTEPNWKSYMVETTEPIFTPEQCEIISKLGRAMPPQDAQVGTPGGGAHDTKTRLSHISWIPNEQAQYTEYPEGGFYDWHMDCDLVMNKEPPIRKISMTLVLSHESEFEGGGLELGKKDNIIKPKQGHAIFFASFINHRVVPITKGLRKSLVMWFGGESFR